MARNRQRAKERKQRQRRDPDIGLPDEPTDASAFPPLGGAPPSDLGTVQPVGFGDDDGDADAAEAPAAAAPAAPRERGLRRVFTFLRACWSELQRVQWPDRRQVGQATAVVLGFVVIAGAFLGLADFVAQRIVNFII